MKKKIKNLYGFGIALAVVLGMSLSLISAVATASEPAKIPCNSNSHPSDDTYTECSTCISAQGTGYNDGKCSPH